MKKGLLLLMMAAAVLSSCEKDKEIKKGEDTISTYTLSLNKEGGREIIDFRTGKKEKQYYYSLQYAFNLGDSDFGEPVINRSSDYMDVAIYKNPEETKEDKLPTNGSWQLLLTEYVTEASYIENGETKWMERPMVGMLINKDNGVSVAQVKDDNFESISLESAKAETYKNDVDVIGIKWWSTDRTTHRYTIVEDNYYLIKVADNEIYKFRFLDFYGLDKATGKAEKGNITFQYELLK